MAMQWEYQPIPRYVLSSASGTELGEIILDEGSYAGLDIEEHWRCIADGSLVGRAATMESARKLIDDSIRMRGLAVVPPRERPTPDETEGR